MNKFSLVFLFLFLVNAQFGCGSFIDQLRQTFGGAPNVYPVRETSSGSASTLSSESTSGSASTSSEASADSPDSADSSSSATSSSDDNNSVKWSTPEECARTCVDGEPPRHCYYKFVVEYYSTMGAACDYCWPNSTNQRTGLPLCECILGDGMDKTVFSINRMIPGPTIQVCLNDYVIIDMENAAEGLEISIHWHGIFQNGYQYYDGVPFLTQCPIAGGNTFRYHYQLKNAGTHFYHSHVSVHMIDGQYGSLIVRKPPSKEAQKNLYDEDRHVIHISDWMHKLSIERYPGHYHYLLGQAPDNILINGVGKWKNSNGWSVVDVPYTVFDVEYGKRYRFRFVNGFSTVCVAQVTIENHNMTIIATDGEDVQPTVVDGFISATGERYDFVLHANQTPGEYWIQVRGLGECEETQRQQFAIIRYKNGTKALSPTPGYLNGIPYTTLLNPSNASTCPDLKPAPGVYCVNQLKSVEETDPDLLKVQPDYRLLTYFDFFNFSANYTSLFGDPGVYKRFFVAPDKSHLASMVGNISYLEAPAPPISQREGYERMCHNPNTAETCTEPCYCTHVYHWPLCSVVEVILYDKNPLNLLEHPFHLHGYSFTLFTVGQFNKDVITDADMQPIIAQHEKRLANGEYVRPPRKDTIIVPVGGYVIYRFKACNPGWWLHHCHFSWHTGTGMDVVFHVGQPSDLPPVPEHFPKCGNFLPRVQ